MFMKICNQIYQVNNHNEWAIPTGNGVRYQYWGEVVCHIFQIEPWNENKKPELREIR